MTAVLPDHNCTYTIHYRNAGHPWALYAVSAYVTRGRMYPVKVFEGKLRDTSASNVHYDRYTDTEQAKRACEDHYSTSFSSNMPTMTMKQQDDNPRSPAETIQLLTEQLRRYKDMIEYYESNTDDSYQCWIANENMTWYNPDNEHYIPKVDPST